MKLELHVIHILMISVLCFGDYFKEYEEQMLAENGRRATSVLQEDLAGSEDFPKEIEIVCPQVVFVMNKMYLLQEQ